jgi:hypothetical protein
VDHYCHANLNKHGFLLPAAEYVIMICEEWLLRKMFWMVCSEGSFRISQLSQVQKSWRYILLDYEDLYARLAVEKWPRTLKVGMGADFLALKREQNIHFSLAFRGFGAGREYEESSASRKRLLKIAEMEQKLEEVEKRFLGASISLHNAIEPPFLEEGAQVGAQVLNDATWRDFVRRKMDAPARCEQCDGTFRHSRNPPDACRFHTRGAGTVFDWDEDDFVRAAHTCCNARAEGAPGCCLGRHSAETEDGLYAEGNRGRDWSTAHM